MIVSILLIVIMVTALVFLFYFFAQRTREDVTTLEEDERKKRDAKGEAKSAQQQQKEQQQQQAVPVLWLDSRKGYKLKGSTEIVEWADARGAQYGIVEVQTDRMPMPTANEKGIGFTSAMLISRQRPTKSANCTLLVACELSAPGEWGTIFGHFNRGTDADGVPWHSSASRTTSA
jgi:type III secretory pathway component EscV